MALNPQNISYNDFKNICRTCLINCELKSIESDNIIIEILHKLTGVNFETNNGFPQQICLNCFEKINDIHAFSTQCKQSHFTLIKCANMFQIKQIESKQQNNHGNNIEFVSVNPEDSSNQIEIKEELTEDITDTETETETNSDLNVNSFQDNLLLPITDIDSNESETEIETESPQEISNLEKFNSLPPKTKTQYERQYKSFMDFRLKNRAASFSESVLLAYFEHLSKNMKPSSLWAIYSMLRLTMNAKQNLDIRKFHKLTAFLKCTSNGYKPKKSLVLTPEQIQLFLMSAPDDSHLFTKVGLIFGMMGGCRREELMKINVSNVDDLQTALLVHIPDERKNTEHQFVIGGNMYHICKKYMELRPENVETSRFFLNYQKGKCTKQPVGINKFGKLASQAATYLKLPEATSYTGHCLRRSLAPTVKNRIRLNLDMK